MPDDFKRTANGSGPQFSYLSQSLFIFARIKRINQFLKTLVKLVEAVGVELEAFWRCLSRRPKF